MSGDRPVRARRTVLAVPGSSERFIAKSQTLPVDAVFLDLEDAVAPSAKAAAREQVVTALNTGHWTAPTVTVRVNDWSTPWTVGDATELVGAAGDHIDAIVLPKCSGADQVRALDLVLTQVERLAGLAPGRIGLEVQIEDAAGLLHVSQIAAASDRLETLVFGPGDFMASLGMGGLSVGAELPGYDADPFHYALMSILVAARANNLQAIDGPYVAIRDIVGFHASAAKSAALGYDGKWVLHPDQVAAGTEAFTPSPERLERARRIVAAYHDASSAPEGARGAIVVDEEMIDEAGVRLAQAILARVG